MGQDDSRRVDELLGAAASGRILSADMDQYVKDCYNGDRPPCRCACPADLDVVALIGKLQRGNFDGAYTAYRDRVLFPAIVCRVCEQPCLDACVRKDIDASIALRKLERATVDHAASTVPTRYNVPKKDERVAVLGAGLCGLSATLKLVSHGYAVTLFERSDRRRRAAVGTAAARRVRRRDREPAAAPRLRVPARDARSSSSTSCAPATTPFWSRPARAARRSACSRGWTASRWGPATTASSWPVRCSAARRSTPSCRACAPPSPSRTTSRPGACTCCTAWSRHRRPGCRCAPEAWRRGDGRGGDLRQGRGRPRGGQLPQVRLHRAAWTSATSCRATTSCRAASSATCASRSTASTDSRPRSRRGC